MRRSDGEASGSKNDPLALYYRPINRERSID